jgi:outer membrane protein
MQDLTAIQRSVQRAARAAYYGIISAISKVNALDKSVSAQQLALQSKQQGNRSGLYTSLDVIDAERDVYEAKRNYARARYEYLLNTLRLKHAVGTLSEADVESINVWLRPGG